MKKFLITVCLLGLAFTAGAQTTDSLKAADKEFREATEQLLTASGYHTSVRAQFPLIMQMMRGMMQDVPDEVFKKLETKFQDVFFNELTNLVTPVYKRYFTLQDIKDYTAFFNTPLGKKVAMTFPSLNKDLMEAGQKVGQLIAMQVIEDLKKEGYAPKPM